MANQDKMPEITGDMKNMVNRAEVLTEALPYIRKMRGQTIVIKYGGNAMVNDGLKQTVMDDITLLKLVGINPVVVHGGGPDINGMLETVGKGSTFVSARPTRRSYPFSAARARKRSASPASTATSSRPRR